VRFFCQRDKIAVAARLKQSARLSASNSVGSRSVKGYNRPE
jgi:hypothetical protein